jgi:membrane-associated protein
VAGVGKMVYTSFIGYCISGGILWVTALTLAGYFFGSIPIVKDNFEVVVMGIIGISVLPILFEFVKANIPRKPAS